MSDASASTTFEDFLRSRDHLAAKEILARDWRATPLGPIEGWPAALRALLAMMLASPAAMFLAWGPDLLCFHNDAYRPFYGWRAAKALGAPFREVWAEIWSDIEPLVNTALSGEGVSVTDFKLDLMRAGVPEESWWSFSYSPVYDGGRVAGMICVTAETTGRVLAERERDAADERLQFALSAGNSIGAWDWDLTRDHVTADARFAAIYGVAPEVAAAGAPIADFFAGVHPEDLPRLRRSIETSIERGAAFHEEYRLVARDGSVRWVSAQGTALRDEGGTVVRFPGVGYDITARKGAEAALLAAKAEREFIIELAAQQRATSDPERIMRTTAESVGKRLKVNRAGFYRAVGPGRLRFSACWTDGTLEPLAGEFSADAYGPRARRQRDSGRALVFSDSRNDRAAGLDRFVEAGIVSGINAPLMADGQWQAGMYLHGTAVRAWSAEEIALAKEVAELTWSAVERAEAQLRLEGLVALQDVTIVQAANDLREQTEGRSVAESQVRQLQKMEAVGQLTGGIAHDFNNMLAVIIGSLNLMQVRLKRGNHDVGRFLDAAMEGATRAASLTQRLLAFSRQQPLAPEPIDMSRLIGDMRDLLGRSLGEAIQLETVLTAGQWKARADLNQLENALLNLAVNARDAMPDGGKLTIDVANISVDKDYARETEMAEGQYVLICVSDTGVGMEPAVVARIFDPFFTTKGVGKGTGLGLSQVFGFVRQSGGAIRVYSEPAVGTTFRLYLPRYWGDEPAQAPRRLDGRARGGSPTEIILVVEDEARVRTNTVEALRELGYTVLHASTGPEALGVLESGQDVTLLLTDIVMPEMTGRQLADRALASRPGLRVLYTTGYTRNAIVHNGTLDPGTHFLAKPFGLDQLALKVREAIES